MPVKVIKSRQKGMTMAQMYYQMGRMQASMGFPLDTSVVTNTSWNTKYQETVALVAIKQGYEDYTNSQEIKPI